MKKTLLKSFLLFPLLACFAQSEMPSINGDITVTQASSFSVSMPLRDLLNGEIRNKAVEDELKEGYEHFPRNPHTNLQSLPTGNDPAWQKNNGSRHSPSTVQNLFDWEGLAGVSPPDPTGAAGPNHYVQAVNSSFAVYDKKGVILKSGTNLGTLWGSGSDGDPIVMYDKYADRFFISQFKTSSPYKMLLAVSKTADPLGQYYAYQFTFSAMPDYPKFGIWTDGYYFGCNLPGKNDVAVFERNKMLAGDQSARMIQKASGLKSGANFIIQPAEADGELPPLGTPNYMFFFEDDGWSGVAKDAIKVLTFKVDWANTANSTLSVSQTLATTPFDAAFTSNWDDIPQKGSSQRLDVLAGVTYMRAQYRKWAGYNTVVLCNVVDVDKTNHAGLRWYELRDKNDGVWSIYQQGTYAPDAESRAHGSISMDNQGNIALAYGLTGTNTYPSIALTGRYAGDPLGQMTIPEVIVEAGAGAKSGDNRYGDYAHMTLDPTDDQTFWFTGNYVKSGGKSTTRIATFKLATQISMGTANPYLNNLSITHTINKENLSVAVKGLFDNESVMVDLFSIQGSLITHFDAQPAKNELQQTFNISNLSNGSYLIRIGNVNFQKVMKVVVAN
jgi:hypothetical protein